MSNPAGENLGKIEDVVLDKVKGQVTYAVLSFGGFLRMGDKPLRRALIGPMMDMIAPPKRLQAKPRRSARCH